VLRMKVLIPARSGSVRIPNKNVKVLGKFPLMVWSINTGLELDKGDVYVSTDSKEYGDIAYKAGAKVVYRDEAGPDQSDLDVVRHFVNLAPCDIVLYLRPTTPFRDVQVVRNAVVAFNGDSLRSVELMAESAYKCFEIVGGRRVPVEHEGRDCTDYPNQSCPQTYHPNGYIDIVRYDHVRDGTLWGKDKQAFVTPRTIEIDTEEDWDYAEYWIQRNPPVRYTFGREEIS